MKDLYDGEIAGTFYEKNCKRQTDRQWLALKIWLRKKVIKFVLNKKVISSFNSWIFWVIFFLKNRVYMGNIKVELEPNSKCDIKEKTGVDQN